MHDRLLVPPSEPKEISLLSTTVTSTVLTHHTRWVEAHEQDGFIAVYHSVLVHDTDPMYQPVKEKLTASPHRAVFSETFEDENMMHGEARLTIYRRIND